MGNLTGDREPLETSINDGETPVQFAKRPVKHRLTVGEEAHLTAAFQLKAQREPVTQPDTVTLYSRVAPS